MINGDEEEGYTLCCDNCGEECEELFNEFLEAVDYKVDRANGWASVKDKDGDWQELCPSCNKPDVIAELKGMDFDAPPWKLNGSSIKVADISQLKFEGF